MKLTSTNPARSYEPIGTVELSTEQDIQTALLKARAVQPKWAALTQTGRNVALESFLVLCEASAQDIATLITKEMGKPLNESRTHVQDSVDRYRAFMAMAGQALAPEIVYETGTERHHQFREPLGVIACIGPWNFPMLNLAWQTGQALLTGNAVVLKQSEEIILFSELIRSLIAKSDLPDGVFQIILGDAATGELLIKQPVDAIFFTGSTRTGQRITELAAKTSTRVLTEMGGSAPGIIFEDADIDRIIDTVYLARFDNTGQYCDGLKRLIVHEDKLDKVLTALAKVNATKTVGDPMDDKTDIGPLVAKRQLDLLNSQVDDARTKGAKIVFGGKEPAGLNGAYYEPTVITNVTADMRVWTEEVFGPVLPVMTFKTEDEAIGLANDTIYGLGAYIFTEDKPRYFRVAKQLNSGMVGDNNALFYSPYTPFGGYKASGNSRTNGVAGFHEVTQIKVISEEKTRSTE
jgi:succinate-semialdehyde dehydrogenase/glutarate-semialdehyde dehydrogenase